MTLITEVRLRRILDSRGNPTVEAEVRTESGGFGRGAAPSGASTGEHEAIERPATEAIAAAREHAVPRIEGQIYAGDQRSVDAALHEADGTENFGEIGANSAVAISMAAAKAAADVAGVALYQHLGGAFRGNEFPTPLGNVLGGGEHAALATDIQEFLSVPVGAPNVTDAVFANAAVHGETGEILEERGLPAAKGDEGAWAPQIEDGTAFEILEEATGRVSEEVGFEIGFGVDFAAGELFEDGTYHYTDTERDTDEQIEYVAGLVEEYGLVFTEDPLDQNDYEGFAELTERVESTGNVGAREYGKPGGEPVICGDDLYVTNTERIREGIEVGAANSVLIKPNQIGTLSDAFDAIELAVENGYAPAISHRSGETTDTTIAHLAVGTGAPFIKTGAVGGERIAKLNELCRIEDTA